MALTDCGEREKITVNKRGQHRQSLRVKGARTEEKLSFNLSKPGTYTYFCSIHPNMNGKVLVQ
jgi:plastocyanin